MNSVKTNKKPAHNKRFGVRRGVHSRKVLREFESLSPVRAFVFPRPNAKPPIVRGKADDSRKEVTRHIERKNR